MPGWLWPSYFVSAAAEAELAIGAEAGDAARSPKTDAQNHLSFLAACLRSDSPRTHLR